jgi:hypothetical protein
MEDCSEDNDKYLSFIKSGKFDCVAFSTDSAPWS